MYLESHPYSFFKRASTTTTLWKVLKTNNLLTGKCNSLFPVVILPGLSATFGQVSILMLSSSITPQSPLSSPPSFLAPKCRILSRWSIFFPWPTYPKLFLLWSLKNSKGSFMWIIVQQRYNSSHICDFNFPSSHHRKSKRNINLSYFNWIYPWYILTCNQLKITNEIFYILYL